MGMKFYAFVFITLIICYISLASKPEQEFKIQHKGLLSEIIYDIVKVCFSVGMLSIVYQSQPLINLYDPLKSLYGRIIVVSTITIFFHSILRPRYSKAISNM